MTNRTIFATLFASLAITACGDDRPVTNNTSNNTANNTANNKTNNKTNNTTNNKTNNTTNNKTNNMTMMCTGTCENKPAECDGQKLITYSDAAFGNPPECECIQNPKETTCAEGEVCDAAQGACVVDTSTPCEVDMDFTGQIEGMGTFDGGVFSTSDASLAEDAGLTAVRDLIKAKVDDGTLTQDNDNTLVLEGDDQLVVTEALITSVTGGNFPLQITLQDKKGTIILRFAKEADGSFPTPTMDKDGNAFTFKVGHKISFKVSKVVAFFGNTPQIGNISELELVSADNDIPVIDATGQDLTVADHWMKNVRIGGRIKEVTNETCGKIGSEAAKCYAFEHGPEGSAKTVTIRLSTAQTHKVGECGTYVGPVGSYPGPFKEDAEVQISVDQFRWYRGPFRQMQ